MSLALALGGGGALGWAHVGVLGVLEREGIGIAALSGSSMGAIVAVACAAGKLERMEQFARSIRPPTLLRHFDPGLGRGGLIGGRAIRRTLARELGILTLEALPIPVALMATDAVTAEPVILRAGGALPAIEASIAVPGVLPPVRLGGRLLVDGGIADPVPVGAVRALSDRPVLAVNLLDDIRRRARSMRIETGRRAGGMALGAQGIALLLHRLTRLSLTATPPDLLIEPAVGAFSPWAFHRAAELIAIGAAATEARLPEIRALASV